MMSKKETILDILMDLQERYDKEYIKMRELVSKTTILNEKGEFIKNNSDKPKQRR
jgi:hypothetical protein